MQITWYGQTCFRINTQPNRNSSVNLLIDPPAKESGLRGPKLEADILLVTSESPKIEAGNYFLITGPGEYEIKEIYIEGIAASENTIYTIEAEEIRVCHLGKLSQKELNPEQLEKIGNVDILMIPIGGEEAIDAKGAIKIMTQIEPKIIIPMYYRTPKLKIKLDTLDQFLKTLGVKAAEPLAKLSIRKKDISAEEAKIIVLQS